MRASSAELPLTSVKKNDVREIDGTTYTVESMLGQGGASKVWRVRSSADGRPYALKPGSCHRRVISRVEDR